MATDRCSYTPDVRGDPDLGRVTCWRPTYHDSSRCIWHTNSGKSTLELEEYDPSPDERLDGAILRGLDLRHVDWLTDCTLVGADFSSANVSDTDLSDADLRKSTFSDVTAHGTDFQNANLERSNLSEADLRGADLRRARLDGTSLSDCRITEKTVFGERVVYEAEMGQRTDRYEREEALETATRTYGKLEQLSQDNSLNAQASQFYRKSKDIRRRFNWQEDNYLSGIAAEASRWFTGYGNRPWRVIFSSLGVILLAGFLYPLVGGLHRTAGESRALRSVSGVAEASAGEMGPVLLESIYFSVVTFTTLGYGNLEPNTTIGQYLAGVEALVGTILLALLVAVLTRSTWLR